MAHQGHTVTTYIEQSRHCACHCPSLAAARAVADAAFFDAAGMI